MTHYIVKRYAPLLTKYDVQTLFKWLSDKCGSIAKAADAAGVQRKTAYDWDRYTEDVKLETKMKILEQSMKLDENRTLEFLIQKTDDDLKDILEHYVRNIFEKAMKANTKEEMAKHLSQFINIQNTHRELIFDHQFQTIEEMNNVLAARATELQLDFPERSTRLIPPEILEEKIIPFLEIAEAKKYTVEEIKKILDLPAVLIGRMCKAINYYDPGRQLPEKHRECILPVDQADKFRVSNNDLPKEEINPNPDQLLSSSLLSARKDKE